MHVLVTHVTVAGLSTSPLLPIEAQKVPGDDIELHFAASAAALQQCAASATIVHVVFLQDTAAGFGIKPLAPSLAQKVEISESVIDEQSAGGAGLQHVFPSSKGLHVEVEHELSSGFSIKPVTIKKY